MFEWVLEMGIGMFQKRSSAELHKKMTTKKMPKIVGRACQATRDINDKEIRLGSLYITLKLETFLMYIFVTLVGVKINLET